MRSNLSGNYLLFFFLHSLVAVSYFPSALLLHARMMLMNYFCESSVRHEYEGEWSGKTRLTTCDPHAKRMVTSSESPQEVDDKKEIIFTYDVDFQVSDAAYL